MSIERKRSDVGIRFGRLSEAQRRYSVGKGTVRKIADQAGAIVRFEGSTLYDLAKMDRFLEGMAGGATNDSKG